MTALLTGPEFLTVFILGVVVGFPAGAFTLAFIQHERRQEPKRRALRVARDDRTPWLASRSIFGSVDVYEPRGWTVRYRPDGDEAA